MIFREDVLLWKLFRGGDWDCYKQLYDRYFRVLNNYGYKFTRDVNLIEDAVHDLFVKMWTNRENLSTPISVKNYLYKSLRGIIFRKLERQSRFTNIDDDYPFFFEVSFDQIVIANEEELALKEKIKTVIDVLPARQQEIVYLRFYEGFSYLEIADMMAINVSSAYKLLYKALNGLETALVGSGLGPAMRYQI